MLKGSVCVDLVMAGMPFLDRIQRVADSGFKAFEFWFWTGKDLDAIIRKKEACGLEVSIMSCSSAHNRRFEDWRFPCLTDPQNRADFVSAVEQSVEVARQLGSSRLNLITGCAVPHLSRAAQWASVVAGLREAGAVAAGAGITLALEPLNVAVDHAGYFLSTTGDTVAVMREVDHPNVKILFDIYHQQVTEGNIIANLTAHTGHIGHVHAADVPGRHQPGTGELHYPHIFSALEAAGYDGYVGLEYAPQGEVMASLAAVRGMFR